MGNKQFRLFRVLGLVLMAAALILTGYNLMENSRASSVSGKTGTELSQSIADAEAAKTPEERLPEIQPDHVNHPQVEMPTKEIDGKLYIGMLSVPSLELELPVLSEYAEADLQLAPCRFSGSVYTDDMVLTAHNYPAHFGPLREISEGDEVIFTDVDNNEFVFRVELIETLRSTAVEEMKHNYYDLTLFTCTIGGYTRLTVRCESVD